MERIDFDYYDKDRSRSVPVSVYLPRKKGNHLPLVIFSPGYQEQKEIENGELSNKNYNFLAEYFTSNNFAFISIQHDILGDNDGLETIDPKAIQDDARKHLFIRGAENILFTLNCLEKEDLSIDFSNIILSGHSNGGDIAKYFMNQYPQYSNILILFDARRAILRPQRKVKVLMFEADDTTKDKNVIADPIRENNIYRSNLDFTIIKPNSAMHASYKDKNMTKNLKDKIYNALDYFLGKSI